MSTKLKSLCFIGARGGSKGVKNKNIRKLGDKPLIAHTIICALESKLFENVVVSTEDHQIAKIAKKYGADVPFMRPKKLSTDSASMIDVLNHGIKKLNSLGYKFDVIVNRDCTVPFIKNSDIKGALELLTREKCDGVVTVYQQHLNPYFNMMEIGKNGFLEMSKKLKRPIQRRQDAPIVYQLNGVFCLRVKNFLLNKKILTSKTLPYEIPVSTGLMIDTEMEFQIADMIAKKQIKI